MASHSISRTGGVQRSNPPTSLLEVLNNTVADAECTNNATALMQGASRAIARIIAVTAVGVAATATLAVVLIHGTGLDPTIGGGIATAGSALAWGIPAAWRSLRRVRAETLNANAATAPQTRSRRHTAITCPPCPTPDSQHTDAADDEDPCGPPIQGPRQAAVPKTPTAPTPGCANPANARTHSSSPAHPGQTPLWSPTCWLTRHSHPHPTETTSWPSDERAQ